MKKLPHILLATLGLASLCPDVASALDFTPVETRSVEDGVPVRRLAFREDDKSIFFQVPDGWKMFGGGQEIAFLPIAAGAGEVRIGNSAVNPSIGFDEPGLAVYRSAARSALPKLAQQVEVLSEVKDAFPLDDWQSFEMKFSYTLVGVKKVSSVLFVTMNPQRQVRLLADGNEKDFEGVYAAARTLLGSWFEPPKGYPTGAPGA